MSVTYVLDENKNIQTVEPKLAYYTSLTCFEAALPNIEVGSLVSMPEEDSNSGSSSNEVQVAPPVGFVYIRFPGMDDPNTLFPGTTWENISSQYPGAFFRAEGGNASAFGSGVQSCLTAVNGLSISVWSSGSHHHNITIYKCCTISGAVNCTYLYGGNVPPIPQAIGNVCLCVCVCSKDVPHTHTVSLSGTINETRPVNYTVQIYERTA